MEKFMAFFQDKIVPQMIKLGNQRHLRAVRNGISITIPFIIVGSLFLIIGNLPIDGWDKILGSFAGKLGAPVNVTFGLIGVLATLGIGYYLAKEYDLEPISGAVISVIAFMTTQLNSEYALSTDNFGSTGLFTGIVVSIVSIEILRYFVKKGIIIKLPEGVPPAIANSFASLLPGGAVLVLVWLVRVVLGFDITHFLSVVFSPLVFALNTLPGILIYTLFVCLLWTVGIHGDSIMGSIASPIFLQYIGENTKAYLAHQPIPYITAEGFWSMFICIGGTGATLSLLFLMFGSKSKLYKSLAKLALPSGIFQINEPVTFGFPIVMNPVIMIPYVLTPLVLTTITYLLMYFNIIGRPVALVPWTMPPVIGPFLVTGGDWRAALWSVVSILLALVIYYPFFKSAERQQLINEAAEEAVNAENSIKA